MRFLTAALFVSPLGHATLVRILLSLGVDANRLTSNGDTPLHCAAKEGHLPCCHALLEKGSLGKLIYPRLMLLLL